MAVMTLNSGEFACGEGDANSHRLSLLSFFAINLSS